MMLPSVLSDAGTLCRVSQAAKPQWDIVKARPPDLKLRIGRLEGPFLGFVSAFVTATPPRHGEPAIRRDEPLKHGTASLPGSIGPCPASRPRISP